MEDFRISGPKTGTIARYRYTLIENPSDAGKLRRLAQTLHILPACAFDKRAGGSGVARLDEGRKGVEVE